MRHPSSTAGSESVGRNNLIDKVAVIGDKDSQLLYDFDWLGDDLKTLSALASGSHPFVEQIRKAKRPIVILGQQVLKGEDPNQGANIYSTVQSLCERLGAELNILHSNASMVGALDLGFKPSCERVTDRKDEPSLLWLIGVDDPGLKVPGNCFVIYQGHTGDVGASSADVILPGAAFTEKQGTYVNTEGRVQQTLAAITPPSLARDDWKIVRAASELANHTLPYDNLVGVRNRLSELAPHLVVGQSRPLEAPALRPPPSSPSPARANVKLLPKLRILQDFWQTDPISRASPTMAKCVTAVTREYEKRGTKW